MSVFVRQGEKVKMTPNSPKATTILIPRDDRAYPGTGQPQVNVQAPADVDGQTSPAPVAYSTFNGVGKVTHARWLYQLLAIEDKLSIRAWEGAGSALVQRIPGAVIVRRNALGAIPFVERADINPPTQTTYGALATFQAQIASAPYYAKIGG